jgi:hypothetical protein
VLESGIQQLVVADAGVQAVIAARLYPVLVPANVIYPCASFQIASDVPNYLLDGDQGLEQVRLQVDTWSGGLSNASYADVKAAQAAIRLVLAGRAKTATESFVPCFKGVLPGGTIVAGIFVVNAIDTYEQDARSYRTTTDYKVAFYPGT